MRQLMGWLDWILCAAVIGLALYVIQARPAGLDMPSAAALAGALFGGAALLLGNGIARLNERSRADRERGERVAKMRALIAAELVDVAAGLLDAHKLLQAAVTSLQAGGPVSTSQDLTAWCPRALPYTFSLGVDLLHLDQPAIDALVSPRANLTLTRQSMDAISAGARFGLLSATQLAQMLAHDLGLLATVFDHIAPSRELELPGKAPELATVILRRAAGQATEPGGQ